MTTQAQVHPSPQQLRAFQNGCLALREMAELELHIASCDSCCRALEKVPDDTLVQLARAAATAGFRAAGSTLSGSILPPGIPPALEDHPRYRVLGLVGVGGMGAVYKAEHRLMERLVALKVISPALLDNAAAVERFRREFRAAARLSHPNVVTAFDADQAGDLHFLVMEFVEGLSLDRLVAQTGPLSVAQACHFIRQAAIGLAHVHEQGMVHRDIKPQNLMVMRKGNLKILDCGLARMVQAVAAEPTTSPVGGGPDVTSAGVILGTPDYIAPEQVSDPRATDIRADIYSLGCTLYFLLTARPPFPHGTITEKLTAHAGQEPPPLSQFRSDVPPGLSRVLCRMLAKDPAARYAAPAEVASDLTPFVGERAAGKGPPPSGEPPPPPLAHDPTSHESATTAESFTGLALSAQSPPGQRSHADAVAKLGPLPIVASLLACGTALAIMILAYAFADRLFTPTRQASGQPSQPVSAQPAKESAVPVAAAANSALPRRALIILPRQGLFLPDFNKVRFALELKGIEVVSASTTLEPIGLHYYNAPQGPPEVRADILLDKRVAAKDYGAIVFTGFRTDEFTPGPLPSAGHVRRLMDEAKREGTLLTAICRGQAVLLLHGELKGKRVAWSKYASDQYLKNGAEVCNSSCERDGRLITAGAADTDAPAFADAIDQALNEKR
jgi:serine/threonine-protein kinase